MACERIPCVLVNDPEEPAPVAAGRHAYAHARSAHARQPLLEKGLFRGPRRHQDLRRHLLPVHVQLTKEASHQPGRVDVLDLVDDPSPAAHHPSPPDEEHLEGRLQVVLHEADHVQVIATLEHHLLALAGLAGGRELVA